MVQYAKCRKAIDRFLKNGRIGEIGHISCIDRGSRIAANDIATASAGRLEGICNLLGQEPAAVTVRSQHNDRVASLQAFLQVDTQVSIHYFATFDDGLAEHELWIEGSKGSLRTNGNSVWWRKQGWPVFIPTRIGLFGSLANATSQAVAGGTLTAAIRKSDRDRETVSLVNRG